VLPWHKRFTLTLYALLTLNVLTQEISLKTGEEFVLITVGLGSSSLWHCQKVWTRRNEIYVRQEILRNGEGNKMRENVFFLFNSLFFLRIKSSYCKKQLYIGLFHGWITYMNYNTALSNIGLDISHKKNTSAVLSWWDAAVLLNHHVKHRMQSWRTGTRKKETYTAFQGVKNPFCLSQVKETKQENLLYLRV